MTKLTINDNYIVQKSGEETLIFSLATSELFTLNESASQIFEMLQQGKSKEEITERLVRSYEISAEEVKKDLKAIKGFLESKKILNKK